MPVENLETAQAIVEWYRCRWEIEIYFRVLKQGCQIERLRLETDSRLYNAIAVYMIVGWRIHTITMQSRSWPKVNCELVFTEREWKTVYLMQKKKKQVYHHELEGLEKGQLCPACEQGRLYKYEPASFVRIIAQAPLLAERHVMKRLRCALCGKLYTAHLPEEVTQDGVRAQPYGYSARAMIALNKFFMGSPYFRQENLQKLLGVSISASSIYDQCAQLAALGEPVLVLLKSQAAQAELFYLDDTGHRILDQQPIEKPNRRAQGKRTRRGVYTSGVIAQDGKGHRIVQFQTNIGHTGEWIDEILSARHSTLEPPVVMSDALSSNIPIVDTQHALCNAHAVGRIPTQ
jgi:hypothetical protein